MERSGKPRERSRGRGFSINPRIAAGALALLRFVAENGSAYAMGPEAPAAILRAVAVLEREA
jgi:hypothetical protein